MLSQLNAEEQAKLNLSDFEDSDNNSSEFSDELEDDSDLSIDDTLDMMEPREDFEDDESCLIEQDSSRIIEYQNFGQYND